MEEEKKKESVNDNNNDDGLKMPSFDRQVSLHNKQLPEEDPNDPFDRQRCVLGWNQKLIEDQVAFVLGCGGLGCTIASMLARLGVKKMYLLDKDVVETSNLNRQILFSKDSVGKKKVEAAAEGLKSHIIGNTEIETLHIDALEDWKTIVETSKKCTVIFNNIDVGEFFDFAVISLAKKLNIPYAAGSSYATTWIAEYFTGKKGASSFTYFNRDQNSKIYNKLVPSKIMDHENLKFIPKDNNPPTRSIGSTPLVCCSAGIMTVNSWIQSLMKHKMPNYIKFDISRFWEEGDTIAWPAPEDEDDI